MQGEVFISMVALELQPSERQPVSRQEPGSGPQTLLQILFKGRAEISVCKLLNTLKALAINVCACVCTKRKMKSSIFQEPDIFQGFILAAILADLFPYNPIPSL